jgi:hypothetical protein
MVGQRRDTSAALQVRDMRRSGDWADDDIAATNIDIAVGRGGMEHDRGRSARQCAFDQTAVDAHGEGRGIDIGARSAEDFPRFRQEHPDADGLENRERALVDMLDLVVGEHADRIERIDELAISCR